MVRPLTQREQMLTGWMIDHGGAAPNEKARLLVQLEATKVVRACPCGCASVAFTIAEHEARPRQGLHIVGDFVFGSEETLSGAFVFSRAALLAGIEVYGLGAQTQLCIELPLPEMLRPFGRKP